MPSHDIIVVGASAGGLEAVSGFLGQLRPDLPAAIFVVIHITPAATSVLPRILNRVSGLRVMQASDGQVIERGTVYVAPPNHHLLVKAGYVGVVLGPRENRHRPAIDPLFRTAARIYGARVIGIALSGSGDDGVAGLRAIHDRGGLTIAQDPADAAHPDLPRNAIEFAAIDYTTPIDRLGPLVVDLVGEPAPWSPPPPSALAKESRLAEGDLATIEDERKVGAPSAFSCPDCGGVLWEIEGGDALRFRCRVGHSYSADALADEQDATLEKALWAALRALEENASLARRMAARARGRGLATIAQRFIDRADEAQANADAIHTMVGRFGSPAHAPAGD